MRVTLRIWPAQGAQHSAEPTSFLKVDPRKKQVTLYDPAAGPPGSSGPRRAAAVAPEMFAFDAVFPQDSEQVRAVGTPGAGAGAPGASEEGGGRQERGQRPRPGPFCFPFLLGPGPGGLRLCCWPGEVHDVWWALWKACVLGVRERLGCGVVSTTAV